MRTALFVAGMLSGIGVAAVALIDWPAVRRRARTSELERQLRANGVPLGGVDRSGWIVRGRR